MLGEIEWGTYSVTRAYEVRRIQKESNSTKRQSFNAGFGEVAVPLLEPKLFYGECNNPDANDGQRSPMALQWPSNGPPIPPIRASMGAASA